jgi:hypothetical protein
MLPKARFHYLLFFTDYAALIQSIIWNNPLKTVLLFNIIKVTSATQNSKINPYQSVKLPQNMLHSTFLPRD